MEFDKSKVFTAVNADEVKVGSKVVIADDLGELKQRVEKDVIDIITDIQDECARDRFTTGDYSYMLAYLVEEPQEQHLKWTDLKVGDIIRPIDTYLLFVVIGIDTNPETSDHIYLATEGWMSDKELKNWELVKE